MAWFHLHRHLRDAFIPHAGNNYHPRAVRHHMLGAYAATLILVKVATVLFVSLTSQPARVSEITPINIIRLSNNERRAGKIPVLKSNTILNRAAQAKANDMFKQQYFAHISPANVTPWFWFKQAGYRYQYAGENLAIDFVQSEDVVQAWMNSPSHRKNVMNVKYKDIGVAVVSGKFNGANSILVVQMFGTPPPAPVKRVATTPAQNPTVTSVKEQLAQAIPVVLGEEQTQPEPEPEPVPALPVAPVQPSIHTPSAGSIIRTKRPEIIGTGEAGSHITISLNGQSAGVVTADAQGVFSLTAPNDVPEGQVTLSAVATARGLSSGVQTQTMTVDTVPPEINVEQSFALLSLAAPDTYDVMVTTTPDVTQVHCSCGAVSTQLTSNTDGYRGVVTLDPRKTTSGVLRIAVSDPAGNETSAVLADTNLFTTGVVAARASAITASLLAVSLSRAFFTIFLAMMLLMALVSVFSHLQHQHHPTIVAMLLVIYLAGGLLLL